MASTVVLIATALFGFLINRAGLIISFLVLVLLSAAASTKFRLEWAPALGLSRFSRVLLPGFR
jgi:hypothetical protein